MQSRQVTTDLVLLGAGHAHVEMLRRHAMRKRPGMRLTLVAREPHTPYSGMLPGLIRGDYDFDAAHIDCARLAAAAGARLVMAEAEGIDLAAGRIMLRGRVPLGYDLLSIDVGGEPSVPPGGGVPVKPIGRFLAHLSELEATLPRDGRIAVVGAGAGGTELALALAWRLRGRARIALIAQDPAPLPGAPARARRIVRQALARAGIEFHGAAAATGFAEGRVTLADGGHVPADAALWVTGVQAPGFLAASGLACDAKGCVRVHPTLRSISHEAVFAAGDCAVVEGAPRPKSGVWAVRAGAPLTGNLHRAVAGRTLRPWRPQRAALVILGLGGGRAVAWRNGFTLAGRVAWRWKDHIDRRWIGMFHRLRPMAMPEDEMRCGGCGAKVGAGALAAALSGLAPPPHPDIPLGLDAPDDAALTLPPPGMAVVQSVDHFRAFLDDPFVFGEIAAAHALSDIHAMGARPWTALAVAAVPNGRRMGDDLAMMMQGAARVLAADGCALVGGHSGEAAEMALGFAVTGLVAPDAAWRKSGLRAGDALVLTKKLGTGIILAAQMRGLARARWLAAALASMRRTNAGAAAVLRAHGVVACTDVTGFGLAGHLNEMLRASGTGATLRAAALPVLDGAAELAA
ncbi:MAG TPA: selenide, water dikinase SelD, partial [Acetobacteraceae bacterium]|nr:selenide, water dikinase SelD [Acetobacteraceae bacterium]